MFYLSGKQKAFRIQVKHVRVVTGREEQRWEVNGDTQERNRSTK